MHPTSDPRISRQTVLAPYKMLDIASDSPIAKVMESCQDDIGMATEGGIRCKVCDNLITLPEELVTPNNRFVHTFNNPAGHIFEVQCFAVAPGAKHSGTPSDYFSWFPGYHWQYAYCRKCNTHLGWYFLKAKAPRKRGFYALNLAALKGDF